MEENKTTTISVKSMDAEIWRRFQAECILRQMSAAKALKEAIEAWLLKKK